jgi:hypothetical protein
MSSRVASLPEGARLSLEAVRIAQEAARVRARRQTLHTRFWFAVSLAAVTGAAFAMAPRVSRWAHARARKAMPARSVAVSHVPVTPMPARTPSAAAAVAIAEAPKPEPVFRPAMERPAPDAAPIGAPAKAHAAVAAAAADHGCDTALIRSAPWRLSPEACAREFDANPTNARLALAIAHAEHVRGHGAEAAQWAKRALSLDPNTAEAYILIARASAEGGRHDEAAAAYQRYLDLAPRGWHQAEARTMKRARGAAPAAR